MINYFFPFKLKGEQFSTVCLSVQKHGLKVYMRDPYSFTPMLEDGVRGRPPRSLMLGADLAKTQQEIGKFSEKDAKVQCH